MLQELLSFIKKPVYTQDTESSLSEKLRILFKLLIIALTASILLLMAATVLESILKLEMGKHAMDDLFGNYSVALIFF